MIRNPYMGLSYEGGQIQRIWEGLQICKLNVPTSINAWYQLHEVSFVYYFILTNIWIAHEHEQHLGLGGGVWQQNPWLSFTWSKIYKLALNLIKLLKNNPWLRRVTYFFGNPAKGVEPSEDAYIWGNSNSRIHARRGKAGHLFNPTHGHPYFCWKDGDLSTGSTSPLVVVGLVWFLSVSGWYGL